MKILGIETSCDETAVCILDCEGTLEKPAFHVLGNGLYSQVKIHAQYGGVFPMMAKREHAKNLVPLLSKALDEAGLLKKHPSPFRFAKRHSPQGETPSSENISVIKKILEREPELFEPLKNFLENYENPSHIDAIAVTSGPGLEPALWVGINFARALGEAWNIPVYPTNHMEGHIISAGAGIQFPALALLISGGHTEMVTMKNWADFEVIGATRDDAVGEAFDKVARILDLPYPGGPEISKLAAEARKTQTDDSPLIYKRGGESSSRGVILPRPMIKSDDYDFSFSGIKTAVLYTVQKLPELTPDIKKEIALEFENAVTEVLIAKVKKYLDENEVKTLILGGGVTANTYIREEFKKLITNYPDTKLLIPDQNLSTDNAVMIAMASYINILSGKEATKTIVAEGNLGF